MILSYGHLKIDYVAIFPHGLLDKDRLGSSAMSLCAAPAFAFPPPFHYSPRLTPGSAGVRVSACPVRQRTDRDNKGNQRKTS